MNYKKYFLACLFLIMQQAVKSHILSDSTKVVNAGVNGNTTVHLLERINKDVLQKSPQLVILMIGTNDMLAPHKRLTLPVFEENYQNVIMKIKKQSEIILMTIPPVYAPYLLERQPLRTYDKYGPQARVDSANAIIKKLAKKNNCQLIDMNKILSGCGGANTEKDGLFMNEANSGSMDGIHPTPNGYRVMAAAIYQTIQLLRLNVKKIVCLGDSITYGYKVKGKGTSKGESYPAVLNKIFNQ